MKKLEIGQRRRWKSKTHSGSGVIIAVTPTAKGPYYTLKTTGHPAGVVSVRASQLT